MAGKLERYREKRDFSLTPEPPAEEGRSAGVLRFVVQKHAASRLHYDFRLEYEGVLKSWAVTRGPSVDPHERRLAVETEDHPLDYATFEGTIPKGEYGGGTVMVWDEGTWAMADGKDAAEGFDHGSLTFDLFGTRLQGRWHLQRMRAEKNRPPQWLLIKSWDFAARDIAKDGGEDVTAANTISSATGRSLEEIAAGDAVWHSNRGSAAVAPPAAKAKRARARKVDIGEPAAAETAQAKATGGSSAARKNAVPDFVEPMLCKARTAPPRGDWLAEVKYDGYRALVRAVGGEVRVLTRSAKDWTGRFPDIVAAAQAFAGRDVLLDGEIVVFDDEGKTRFSALQKAFTSAGAIRAAFIAFDILFDGGEDVRGEPIEDRKARVAALVGRDGVIRYGDHIAGKQAELYARAEELGLEGIVAKKAGSTYRSGRTEAWVKVRATKHHRFVIGAWTDQSDGKGLGALTVGGWHDGKLVPCGRVGTGFSRAEAARLLADLQTIATPKTPFAKRLEGRGHHFVRPERVIDVAYLTMTDDGQVRHGVYHGVVEDDPGGVTLPSDHPLMQSDRAPDRATAANASVDPPDGPAARSAHPELPAKPARRKTAKAGGTAPTAAGSKPAVAPPARRKPRIAALDDEAANEPQAPAAPVPRRASRAAPVRTGPAEDLEVAVAKAVTVFKKGVAVLGVPLTHPDKVLFAEVGVTKQVLAEHYVRHMDRILPHIVGRPLTLVRCPMGRAQKCFYQRHPEGGLPARFGRDVGEGDGLAIVVETSADVIELVQKGVLEIHLRGSRAEKPDYPDRLVIDLDPGEGVGFEALKSAAFDVRRGLAAIDLEAFVKTTGGKGLHVVVPVERRVPWAETKAWTRAFSEAMADAEPTRFLINMKIALRKNRIFIDYLRNDRKASAVAPYSSRSREGAPFSFPITWEELETLDQPAPLHVGENAPGDPWADMDKVKQRLTAAHLKMVR